MGGKLYKEGDQDETIIGRPAMWEDASNTLRAVSAAKPLPVESQAGSALIGKTQPFAELEEGGLTELVGINEQVDQDDYGGSVDVELDDTHSGEILKIVLYSTEDGTGAVQTPAGTLFIFDADPSISPGDTAMSAAARVTVIDQIEFAAADWKSDANGASVVNRDAIPFHPLGTLYFAWFHEDATSLNDGAGDDEQLEMNFWYRRDS